MNRLIPLLIFVLVFIPSGLYAGKFAGLEPGVSTKEDADDILGTPIREVTLGFVYDYAPAKYDLTRLSVTFDDKSEKIAYIDLYSDKPYSKSQYREWFSLGAPFKTDVGPQGDLVEYYIPQGVSLHYGGATDASEVVYISHFDPALIIQADNKERAHQEYLKADAFIKQNNPSAAIPYLEKAIELNPEEPFYYGEMGYCLGRQGNTNAAIRYLRKLLELRPDQYPNYLLGLIYWERKDFSNAILYLKEAVRLTHRKSGNTAAWELLGSSYFEKGMIDEAFDTFKDAYKIDSKQPVTVFYLSACFDRKGYTRDAIKYYKLYLDMGHNSADMRRTAASRLQALERSAGSPGPSAADSLSKLIDIIGKDIKEFQEQ